MTGKSGIIYLQKDKFQLYSPFLRQIAEFRFVPEIVRDLDVINKEMLENLIKVFITNAKVPPSNLTIVLADNAYFVKDYVLPPQQAPKPGMPTPPQMSMETLQVMSLDFIEHVPYENVVSKTFPLKNGLKVCAVNKDFFDAIKDAFEKIGFKIDAVYPGLVLGNNLSARPVMDGTMVNAVTQKAGSVKEFDLLNQEVYVPQSKKGAETSVEMEIEDTDEKNKKPDKKRLYLMVGVLGFLIVILIVVYMQSLTPPPVPAAPTTTVPAALNAATAVSSAPAVPTVPPAAAASIPNEVTRELTAQILNASGSDEKAQTLRNGLGKFTFSNLTTQTQPGVGATTTSVSFSGEVTQEVRNAVLAEVNKVTTNISVQEKATGNYDITILLAK